MADEETTPVEQPGNENDDQAAQDLGGGAYEVLRKRLVGLNSTLCDRLEDLNRRRREVFGGQETRIVGNDRIPTENNCVPRDIVGVGNFLIFGYNVFIGLRSETTVSDVFSVHSFDGSALKGVDPELLSDPGFQRDFKELYRYYKHTRFLQFVKRPGRLFMVFQTGEQVSAQKVFRFSLSPSNTLAYMDDRGDLEYAPPPQHEFEWTETTREDQVQGMHPHVNIADQVFVECIEGDLTIKVEDNTETGEGIYSEPVDNPDQTLDDADIYYACVGDLILLRIRPYRERGWRHFVFNTKRGTAVRIDSIDQACILLPEDHGIIFPRGYYLQEGTFREFDEDVTGMIFLECIKSPNGEDFLYVFYHVAQGRHVLLQYNLISKELANPIFCHGYSIYDDGKMVLFSAPDDEPRRIHAMQIWQTPFCADTHQLVNKPDSGLATIGNRDLVRGISEGYAVSRLITSEHITLQTYQDVIRSTTALLDSHHWLEDEEAGAIGQVVRDIKSAAVAAVSEYEKVLRIRENTAKQLAENEAAVRQILLDCTPDRMASIDDFVKALAAIRSRRGHVISLRDLRYADEERIEQMDSRLAEAGERLALACVDFLLRDDALAPYAQANEELAARLDGVAKIADVKPVSEELEDLAGRLDLLTDVVNNLEIEDATQTTRIIDAITAVYAGINRTRALIRGLRNELGKAEAQAEFAAQFKLISQSVTNYIGMCDSPAKCDELLTKVMITLEELEGRFADFDDFVRRLSDKREEAYAAFQARKQVLEEEKKRRVGSMQASADRILQGIVNRAETFRNVDEVNAYFASDIMVAKLRDIISRLHAAGESVKADDLTGQLKSAKDAIIRRLRDKIDLFKAGDNVISLGDYAFTVNTQPLELTTVYRDGAMFFHLTGTDYYEEITDPEFLETRDLWDQELVSETPDVYRGEYLAYQVLAAAEAHRDDLSLEQLTAAVESEEGVLPLVREYAADLYDQGYDKGVHDHDAACILTRLVGLYRTCGLLRYDSTCRALAIMFWCFHPDKPFKDMLRTRMQSVGDLPRVFGTAPVRRDYQAEIETALREFRDTMAFPLDESGLRHTAEYLYYELQDQGDLEFTVNALAHQVCDRFIRALKDERAYTRFTEAVTALGEPARRIHLIHDWVATYSGARESDDMGHLVWEVTALLAAGDVINRDTTDVSTFVTVADLLGQHPRIQSKSLALHLDRFLARMKAFAEERVPRFRAYMRRRSELTAQRRDEMRLSEFRSRVMGSFVRNKLINDVYLNLVGANFAKQIGVAGEAKRTDLMGLLLLVSPPGYGKTTLMEYMANRLGLTFMKVNGPAIGSAVTSLDPAEAPNATAREELNKLNLAFEMGNNVMIYLDDIQHLNPELLQKFISLCDAQRKIEGVYRGRTRTYDLRGKKVAVVMAGNPYTESGESFKIPDMLANRADTYNLGDITSTAADAFALSFIENAMTSNPVLSEVENHCHEDVYKFAQAARRGSTEGIEFEYSYSASEVDDIISVVGKLLQIRDVVLSVNKQYIASAAQHDDYRTEPPFKLQGSYRNMNRMAERVYPVMTDREVQQLIADHYSNEAQTLTTGAESNLLKFRELTGTLSDEERVRWEAIKTEFNRRQALSGVDDSDDIGRVLAQLSAFSAGMGHIKTSLDKGFEVGFGRLAEAFAHAGEAGRPAPPDFGPLVKALGDNRLDLEPLIEALAKPDRAPPAQLQTAFPPEYAKAWQRQILILESLLPILEALRAQGATFARIQDLLEALAPNDTDRTS